MSVRPGINFETGTAANIYTPPSGSDVFFLAGTSVFGRTDIAQLVRTPDELVDLFGARDATKGIGWDAAFAALQEGTSRLYFGRLVGPSATADAHTFKDGSAVDSIHVVARGEGASGLSVQIVNGRSSGKNLLVIRGGVTLETSPDLTAPADIANWSASSSYILVTAVGTVTPAVIGATALSGGADDVTDLDDPTRITQLARLFPRGLGPGQVAIPGSTSDSIHEALNAHAIATNRHALLDPVDTPTAATLVTEAATVRTDVADASYSSLYASWLTIPGVVPNTTRTVPPSCIVAGLMARNDAVTGDQDKPAAGGAGLCRYATGLTQNYSDADRQTLNDAGVNAFVQLGVAFAPNVPRLYGYRTLADPEDAGPVGVNEARLRMAIQYKADLIGETFMFDEIDGQGHLAAAFGGALTGMLLDYWTKGALFGATAADAFSVDVGPTVNTPTTIADRQLRAVVQIRVSQFAEMITFTIISVPLTQQIAA